MVSGVPLTLADEGYLTAYVPRSNYDSLFTSLVTIFQCLTGENWNEVYYDAARAVGAGGAAAYHLALVILGQFVILNLFLAILLGNFAGALLAHPPLPLFFYCC